MSSIAKPATPVAPWIGGKRFLAREIIARIERTPHRLYAEPFVGMAGVFLRKGNRSPVEVINDRARDVATLFRVLQRHYRPFLDVLAFQLTSRDEFKRLAETDPDTLTDLERAARFLYLQRVAYGGRVRARTFGVSRTTPARFDTAKLEAILEAAHRRLSSVVIEQLPYAEFIERYDGEGTLFYLDPPYWGCEGDYGVGLFSRDDFAALEQQLGRIKGQFILSLNDLPETRRLFSSFTIETAQVARSIGGNQAREKCSELIISGGGRRS